MKLSLTFPVLLTARPDGSRKLRDLHLSSRAEYEIPEFALAEAEVAYRPKGEKDNAVPLGKNASDVVRFEGKLFRPLGRNAVEEYFTSPFFGLLKDSFVDQGVGIHFERRLQLGQALGLRSRRTWPDPVESEDSRNTTALEDVIHRLNEIDAEEYQEAAATVKYASRGLAMFSGSLWCETIPPRIGVNLDEWHTSPGYKVFARTGMHFDFPALHYHSAKRMFSLGDEESAKAFVKELRGFPPKKKRDVGISWFGDMEAFIDEEPYDGHAEQIRCISRELAYASVVTAHAKPALAKSLSDESLKLLDQAKSELLRENCVIGRRFDGSDYARGLLEAWRVLGRPKAAECLGWKGAVALDEFLETTIDSWEPVSVPVKSSLPNP